MRGLFATAPGKMAILELPIPEPGPYQALLKTEACAICNSTDTKLLHGQFFGGTWPVLLGHEVVGRVLKLGPGVANYKLGDLVLRGTLPDSAVPYPGGRSCWGGYVEYNLVTDVWARDGKPAGSPPHPQQVVPAAIDPVHATALITLKENLSVLSQFDVVGRTVGIVGTGPVAQSMTLFAKKLGARYVAVLGRREEWRARFEALGADAYIVDEAWPPSARELLAFSGNSATGGFERVFEAVGSRTALKRCVQVAGARGLVCVYGVAPADEPHDPADLALPNVKQPPVTEALAHDQLLAWVASGEVRLADWVDAVLPLNEFARGFELVWSKQASKVVLTLV
jgi:threonine dehydrogenase-like Zn-dependent dehydrogenase